MKVFYAIHIRGYRLATLLVGGIRLCFQQEQSFYVRAHMSSP